MIDYDELNRRLARIEYGIFGNGEPGIKTRLDRLEQDAARRKWHIRAVVTGVIAALAVWLREVVSKL